MRTTADKLLIKPSSTLWVSDRERVALLGPLPDDARLVDELAAAETAVLFVTDAASARALLEAHTAALGKPAALWFAYPKGNTTDINRDSLAAMVMEHNVRPITQISLGETWSALRFRPYKEGEPPFAIASRGA